MLQKTNNKQCALVDQKITPRATEWPTVMLIIFNWIAFLVLTLAHQQLPWWLILPLGGFIVALYGSLQHEVLHGHPTPNQRINEAIIFPNISLWIPYALYKSTHLTHHINHQLTDPKLDPESFYLSPEQWHALSKWSCEYYRFYNTFIGRFFLGPFHIVGTLWMTAIREILSGNWQTLRLWSMHCMACLPVLYWVLVICDISWLEYVFLWIYPGLSLTLLRSFIEHQAVANIQNRSIIVETHPLLSLMFLNNNLHALHHAEPHLPWYQLPQVWQASQESILSENGHYYFSGYLKIIKRYWLTAKESPKYPL